MLCPEVVNFEAPKSRINIKKANITDCINQINNLPYNYLVITVTLFTKKIKYVSCRYLLSCQTHSKFLRI